MNTDRNAWASGSLRSQSSRVGAMLAGLMLCMTVFAQPAPSGPPSVGGPGDPPPGFGGPPSDAVPPNAGGPSGSGGPSALEVPFLPPVPPVPPNAPQPSPDPRNFDGTWWHADLLEFQIKTDLFGNKTPLNAAGQKVLDRRVKSLKDGTPFINASAKCFPMGQPWQMDLNMPFQIFQSKDRLDVLFEEYHGALQISLDPAKAQAPGYMGSSVAHWDGNTLVVETTGYEDGLWLDVNGTPASKNAKLTQRIRKVKTDHWFLEVISTLDDPTYYTRPWSWARSYSWRPDMMLFREYDCEVQTGAPGGMDSTLVPEPQE